MAAKMSNIALKVGGILSVWTIKLTVASNTNSALRAMVTVFILKHIRLLLS